MKKQYGFIFDSDVSRHEGQFCGTVDEIVEQYLRATKMKLRVGKDEKGKLGYFVTWPGDNEWVFQDHIKDTGDERKNLEAARADFFESYIIPASDEGHMVFEIAIPEQAQVLDMTADDILDRITAKEFLKADLDYEYLFDLQKWYLKNKLGARILEAA